MKLPDKKKLTIPLSESVPDIYLPQSPGNGHHRSDPSEHCPDLADLPRSKLSISIVSILYNPLILLGRANAIVHSVLSNVTNNSFFLDEYMNVLIYLF